MTVTGVGPDAQALREAADGLVGVAERTPLEPVLDRAVTGGHPLHLKLECRQPIGAFKIRGAWTALRRLAPDVRARGVVAFSSGNHAQGVAWAAHRLGVPATIVMPGNTPAVKVDGVRRWGGRVVFADERRSPAQQAEARRLSAQTGAALIPPYDHPDVICGQGTAALEVLEDHPAVRTLLVPVSGGGFLAGTCAAVRAMAPHVRVVAVEPAGAAKLSAAMAHGAPVAIGTVDTIADGLMTPQVGALTWPIIREVVHEVVAVTDDEIVAALRWLWRHHRLRTEPSGACAFAAVLARRLPVTDDTVVMVSGGNVDEARFAALTA